MNSSLDKSKKILFTLSQLRFLILPKLCFIYNLSIISVDLIFIFSCWSSIFINEDLYFYQAEFVLAKVFDSFVLSSVFLIFHCLAIFYCWSSIFNEDFVVLPNRVPLAKALDSFTFYIPSF